MRRAPSRPGSCKSLVCRFPTHCRVRCRRVCIVSVVWRFVWHRVCRRGCRSRMAHITIPIYSCTHIQPPIILLCIYYIQCQQASVAFRVCVCLSVSHCGTRRAQLLYSVQYIVCRERVRIKCVAFPRVRPPSFLVSASTRRTDAVYIAPWRKRDFPRTGYVSNTKNTPTHIKTRGTRDCRQRRAHVRRDKCLQGTILFNIYVCVREDGRVE